MKLPADLDPSRTRRRARERVIAPIAALLVLMACLVLPLIVQALVLGLGPDSPLPDSAGWWLVVGGGIGAGAAYSVFASSWSSSAGSIRMKSIGCGWDGTSVSVVNARAGRSVRSARRESS